MSSLLSAVFCWTFCFLPERRRSGSPELAIRPFGIKANCCWTTPASMYIVMFTVAARRQCYKEKWCSMSRFNDDLHGIGDFPEWRPYTSVQLVGKLDMIGKLDLDRSSLADKRAAVADWLAVNDAHPKLLASLEADHLIDPPSHSAA